MNTPEELEQLEQLERVRIEAQKAAWEFDHVNDACPYPFASVLGATFKEAFLTAQAIQRNLLTLPRQS